MSRQENSNDKCPFCSLLHSAQRPIIAENEYGFSIEDKFPVSRLHCLVIPKRHVTSFFDIETREASALQALLKATKSHIEKLAENATDTAPPTSFNIGINDGVAAGQTIAHLHIHLIPRYQGDMQISRWRSLDLPGKSNLLELVMEQNDLLATFKNLSTWKRGTRRAPHKPILCLYSMAQLQAGESRLDFHDACGPLEAILKNLLPNQKNPNAHYPFWYLKNDGIWEIENAENIPTREGKPEPLKSELKKLHIRAGFSDEVVKLLLDNPCLISDSATEILNANFPESIHEDVLKLIGLDTETTKRTTSRNRDPKFRERILTTYGYRCAVCGYSLRLMEATIGLEAAHIKWHQAGGPNIENNGFSLCCLHHKLFDRGIFTVDEDMQILVSNRTNGELAEEVILRFDGTEIALPRKNEHYPSPDYLHWHRSEVYAG